MVLRRERDQPETDATPVALDPFKGDPEARALSDALAARDFATATAIMAGPDPVRQQWLVRVAHGTRGLLDIIDDLLQTDPGSAMLLTVKGLAYVDWAWAARGIGWADDQPGDAWATVRDRLRQAEDLVNEAVERDPAFIPARTALITLAVARSEPIEERLRRFEAAVAVDPWNVAAHRAMLAALTTKRGGSSEQLFAFARERASGAPGGHDLPVLIADAHTEEWLVRGREDEYLEQPDIGDELVAAAQRSFLHPDYRYQHGLTPATWNAFAFPLSVADRFDHAAACFDRIGDTLVEQSPWNLSGNVAQRYTTWRTYVTEHLAYRESVAADG